MIDALRSLWRELLGSWWVLIVIPALVLFRWVLSSRWGWIASARASFFGRPFWNRLLSPPEEEVADRPAESTREHEAAEQDDSDGAASMNGSVAANGAAATGGSSRLRTASSRFQSVDYAASEFRRRWFLELVESALVALLLVFFIIRPFIVQAFYIPSPSMVETLEVYDRILVNKFVYHLHSPRRGDVVVFEPPELASGGRTPSTDDWIKRVIGIPGDTISVHDNHLYLNGVAQNEPYAALLDPRTDKPGTVHVSTGQYIYVFPDPEEMNVPVGQNAYIKLADDTTVTDQRYLVQPTTDATPRAGGDYLFFVRNDPRQGLEAVVPPGKVFVMGDNRNDSEDSHYWGYLDQKSVLGQAFCIFWPFSHARLLSNPHSHGQ